MSIRMEQSDCPGSEPHTDLLDPQGPQKLTELNGNSFAVEILQCPLDLRDLRDLRLGSGF